MPLNVALLRFSASVCAPLAGSTFVFNLRQGPVYGILVANEIPWRNYTYNHGADVLLSVTLLFEYYRISNIETLLRRSNRLDGPSNGQNMCIKVSPSYSRRLYSSCGSCGDWQKSSAALTFHLCLNIGLLSPQRHI